MYFALVASRRDQVQNFSILIKIIAITRTSKFEILIAHAYTENLEACLYLHLYDLNHSNKKLHNLEVWTVKLRFLLTYENMLKNIAMARSDCTVKHENKPSHKTDLIVPDLIDFFGVD